MVTALKITVFATLPYFHICRRIILADANHFSEFSLTGIGQLLNSKFENA